MYALYKEHCDSSSEEPVSEWVYGKVFNEEYNLSFGQYIYALVSYILIQLYAFFTSLDTHPHTSHTHTHTYSSPRTDTCKTCDEFKVQVDAETDPDAQEQLRLEWEVHKTHAENAYQCIREDTALSKSTSDIEMLTFDLEQALATPLLTTNVVFYKRQLWTYNLGIHDCKTGKGCMHMWQEGIASRGSHEIGSCLLLHLRNMQSRATKLTLYSDSCGGQTGI